jgi:hypothetical protein
MQALTIVAPALFLAKSRRAVGYPPRHEQLPNERLAQCRASVSTTMRARPRFVGTGVAAWTSHE